MHICLLKQLFVAAIVHPVQTGFKQISSVKVMENEILSTHSEVQLQLHWGFSSFSKITVGLFSQITYFLAAVVGQEHNIVSEQRMALAQLDPRMMD